MNREDAIKVLRTESIELGGSVPSVCRFWEALDMAIVSLMDQEGKDTYVPTNADRIRAMRDEELVEFIKNIKVRAALCKAVGNNDAFEELCSAEWLQQSAEEDDHEQ